MRRALLLATLLAGCSFPDPTIDDTLVVDSGFPDTRTDTSSDASVMDTAMVDSAAETSPADAKPSVCETMNECDCDGDGDEAKRTGCSGNDCDDGDPRRNSLVTAFLDLTPSGHAGDWNCDGNPEREFPDKASCGGLALGPCASAKGYKETAPACGGTATLITCKVSGGVLCVENTSETVKVKCR